MASNLCFFDGGDSRALRRLWPGRLKYSIIPSSHSGGWDGSGMGETSSCFSSCFDNLSYQHCWKHTWKPVRFVWLNFVFLNLVRQETHHSFQCSHQQFSTFLFEGIHKWAAPWACQGSHLQPWDRDEKRKAQNSKFYRLTFDAAWHVDTLSIIMIYTLNVCTCFWT